MSKVYRIHGARFLRKYTAAEKSSNYAYMADVRKIADTLCNVPWTRVSGDVAATTTIHTEEGIDWNEPERDRFDAAEWCGEHADGFHRAFAQAACYVFKLPASAVGKAIEKIRVNVTSDPYNPYGARIAAMTSATLEIPMDCQTVREGEVFRAPDEDGMGAAPRLFRTNADGTQTWYANSEIVELEPGETLTAKQYLFVFVALENYNRGRDGWIEGSSYIDNDVELTLSAAASDLVEDELNDLSPAKLNAHNLTIDSYSYPVDGVIEVRKAITTGHSYTSLNVEKMFRAASLELHDLLENSTLESGVNNELRFIIFSDSNNGSVVVKSELDLIMIRYMNPGCEINGIRLRSDGTPWARTPFFVNVFSSPGWNNALEGHIDRGFVHGDSKSVGGYSFVGRFEINTNSEYEKTIPFKCPSKSECTLLLVPFANIVNTSFSNGAIECGGLIYPIVDLIE